MNKPKYKQEHTETEWVGSTNRNDIDERGFSGVMQPYQRQLHLLFEKETAEPVEEVVPYSHRDSAIDTPSIERICTLDWETLPHAIENEFITNTRFPNVRPN